MALVLEEADPEQLVDDARDGEDAANEREDARDGLEERGCAPRGEANRERRAQDPDTGLAEALHRQCTTSDDTAPGRTLRKQQRRVVVTYHPNLNHTAINAALRERDETTDGLAWRARPRLSLPQPKAPPGAKRSRPRGGRLVTEATERGLI